MGKSPDFEQRRGFVPRDIKKTPAIGADPLSEFPRVDGPAAVAGSCAVRLSRYVESLVNSGLDNYRATPETGRSKEQI